MKIPNNQQANEHIRVSKKCIAIRYSKGGRAKIGLFDAALSKIIGSVKAKRIFMKELAKEGLFQEGHGHAGTRQERIKIKHAGQASARTRLWVLNADELSRYLKKSRGPNTA